MRIAVPTSNGVLAEHFGHCEAFSFMDVNEATNTISSATQEPAPPHEPGLLPRWLEERGVNVVISGGMGSRAQGLFKEAGIQVVTGAESRPPEVVARDYIAGALTTRPTSCHH